MNKLTRMLTMGGFGLLTALAVGTGPVQAAPAHEAVQAKPAAPRVQFREGVQIIGYYRTWRDCQLAGQFGEQDGYWDAHSCTLVRLGPRTGAWALQVASYDDWDRLGFAVPVRSVYLFPVRFRPIWPGQYGPGRPFKFGHRGPAGPGHGHGPGGHGPGGHGGGHGGPGRR